MTAVAPVATADTPAPPARGSRPAIVCAAMLLLLCTYALLALANDPRGNLGSDTGGKLATLEVMDARGTFSPDVGYWAADLDPRGDLHPLYYTYRTGHGWVNVTTLPMLVAARPLYALGGPRAVLLLPMLGAAFAALAARALARRVAGGDGWFAFWAVGLASPLAVYALDFWEHAPGVALACWGVVFAYDVVDGRAGWRGAGAAGLLFGLAATMRTDVLVYAAVAGIVSAVLLVRRARDRGGVRTLLAPAGAGLIGLVVPLVANQLLERGLVGAGIRAGRASDTAAAAGTDLSLRVSEALTTAVGLNRFAPRPDQLVGAFAVVLVAYGAWRLTDPERRSVVAGALALAGALVVYALRFGVGWGFVPGLLTASPLAAAGLAVGWSARRWRPLGAVAVVAVPLVWATQYSGGAAPQWGGRYLLVSGALLAVGAAVVLSGTPGIARWLVLGLAAVVTVAGLCWLSQMSHAIADTMRALPDDRGTVVISREPHVLRAGGAFYTPDRRWLTAEDDAELVDAFGVAGAVDAPAIVVLANAGRTLPGAPDGYRRASVRKVEYVPGVPARIVTYRRSEGA